MESVAGTVRALAARNSLKISRQDKRLLEAAVAVRTENPIKVFLASQLVQCTLPHSDPGNVEWWSRTNGHLTLAIRSGGDAQSGRYGIPYGTIPRLLLFWINTEATRTKSRTLELGSNLSAFMEQLELDPSRGGPRSDAARLREQMKRLFRSIISFTYKRDEPGRGGKAWLDMLVAESGSDDSFQWWDPGVPRQSALWSESITLGERFFQAITTSPVPTNMHALRALRNSSLLLDLYAWSTHKAFIARQRGEPLKILWPELAVQLGADYGQIKEFARYTRKALGRIQSVYPGFHCEIQPGAVMVFPNSELAIAD